MPSRRTRKNYWKRKSSARDEELLWLRDTLHSYIRRFMELTPSYFRSFVPKALWSVCVFNIGPLKSTSQWAYIFGPMCWLMKVFV